VTESWAKGLKDAQTHHRRRKNTIVIPETDNDNDNDQLPPVKKAKAVQPRHQEDSKPAPTASKSANLFTATKDPQQSPQADGDSDDSSDGTVSFGFFDQQPTTDTFIDQCSS
jgi:hypothetical protein